MDRSAEPDLAGIKVLLIEPSPERRRSLETPLARAGCEVVAAADGFAALGRILAHRPDIVLAASRMPRVDGLLVCRLIRKHARFSGTPVVLVCAGNGFFERARAGLAGCDAILAPPFTAQELLGTIAAHCACAPGPRRMAAPAPA